MRLCSAAGCGSARVAGVLLRAIGVSVGEADELGCAAAQEDAAGFYQFLLIYNNFSCAGRLGKA